MNVLNFPLPKQMPAGWQFAEVQKLLAGSATPLTNGDVSGWDVGATDSGYPQFYLLGPGPDYDCLLCISRLGRLYVLEDGTVALGAPRKTYPQAIWQIIVADVSMSLDNVLAVAGAAREHPYILIFGLALSIGLMGIAASFIARLLQKHRWIAYVGFVIILYVALDMCYRGVLEIWPDALTRLLALF